MKINSWGEGNIQPATFPIFSRLSRRRDNYRRVSRFSGESTTLPLRGQGQITKAGAMLRAVSSASHILGHRHLFGIPQKVQKSLSKSSSMSLSTFTKLEITIDILLPPVPERLSDSLDSSFSGISGAFILSIILLRPVGRSTSPAAWPAHPRTKQLAQVVAGIL